MLQWPAFVWNCLTNIIISIIHTLPSFFRKHIPVKAIYTKGETSIMIDGNSEDSVRKIAKTFVSLEKKRLKEEQKKK